MKNFHINSIPIGLAMRRNSILYPIFEDITRKLIPSGIPQYKPKIYGEFMYKRNKRSAVAPQKILAISDLAFGFILWLIACGVSTAVFIGECMTKTTSNGSKAIISWINGYIWLICIFYFIKRRFRTS